MGRGKDEVEPLWFDNGHFLPTPSVTHTPRSVMGPAQDQGDGLKDGQDWV